VESLHLDLQCRKVVTKSQRAVEEDESSSEVPMDKSSDESLTQEVVASIDHRIFTDVTSAMGEKKGTDQYFRLQRHVVLSLVPAGTRKSQKP
jgi:hypothetical protein